MVSVQRKILEVLAISIARWQRSSGGMQRSSSLLL